ncbi:hypothetical protein E4U42_006527 [Claviceps africana]|uniref:DAGKc domain-containing protein n=1 Tax=Claviceps africana TaxID=83212 RepID=A0A8K0J538_9HYPO|nr:hypothetical protein E4U42_006527 [Claviceps africana]
MASAATSPPPSATSARIQNVVLQDDNLTWTYVRDQQSGHAPINQLIFVIKPAQQPRPSSPTAPHANPLIICRLQEDPVRAPFFSLHLLTVTDAVLPDELFLRVPLLRASGLPGHLQTTPNNEVDVVLSIKSGTGRAQFFWTHVVRPLLLCLLLLSRGDVSHTTATEQQGEPWNVLTTQDEHTVRRYADNLHRQSKPRRTIVLISGDGGIVDLLNGRRTSTRPPTPLPHLLALLPLGTANALFHSLHKPLDTPSSGPTPLVLALRTLFLGTPRKLPIFKALFTPGSRIVSYTSGTDKKKSDDDDDDQDNNAAAPLTRHDTAVSVLYGAIVASYALHASIVHESDTPEYRIHGSKRFSMVAQHLLQQPHPYQATLEVQPANPASPSPSPSPSVPGHYRHVDHTTHGYILVSMVSNLERTFTISPATKPLDGTLHLVHIGAVDQQKIMQAMTAAYHDGAHTLLAWDNGHKVLYDEVAAVRVTTHEEDARWRNFCVDGTIVEVERGGGMVVERVDEAIFSVLVDDKVGRRGGRVV